MRFLKNINRDIAFLIVIATSIVSPYVSGALYKGYTGLFLLILFSFFIMSQKNIGRVFKNEIIVSYKKNKEVFYALMWYILGVFFTFLRGADDRSFFLQIISLPIFYFIGLFLSRHEKYRVFAILSIIFFVFINVVLKGGDIDSSMSARDLYMDTKGASAGTSGFWGLIGVFSSIFLVAVLQLKNKILRFSFFAILFYIVIKMFFSGFATPIALLLINFSLLGLFYFRYNFNLSIKVFKTTFIVLVFGTGLYFILNTILNTDLLAIGAVQSRFSNFIENPLGGGYESSSSGISRFKLIQFSWETFINNPLFGKGGNVRTSMFAGVSGGHSSAVDYLAILGLLGGGGAFLYFIISSFRTSYKRMHRTKLFNDICNFTSVCTFIIGGIMNPYWQGPILLSFLLIVNIYKVQPKHKNITWP